MSQSPWPRRVLHIVPALFDASLFSELLDLKGDRGAKSILEKYAAETLRVQFPDGKIDIDTPEDYARLGKP